jgi:GGDEF domain-containing protein
MRRGFHPTLFLTVIVAPTLAVWVAIYSPIEFQLPGATLVAIAGILVASSSAVCISARTTWVARLIAHRKRPVTGARTLMDRVTFVEYADRALAQSNRTSCSILLVEIDCAAPGAGPSDEDNRDAILIEAGVTVSGIAHRGGGSIIAKFADDQFAILIGDRLSDQVLATAEQILAAAIAMRDSPPITARIGICFCLPNTTTDAALRTAQDALRLAKRSGGNAWRSIAEGGTRAVTRRSLRAPTLPRTSSGAVQT